MPFRCIWLLCAVVLAFEDDAGDCEAGGCPNTTLIQMALRMDPAPVGPATSAATDDAGDCANGECAPTEFLQMGLHVDPAAVTATANETRRVGLALGVSASSDSVGLQSGGRRRGGNAIKKLKKQLKKLKKIEKSFKKISKVFKKAKKEINKVVGSIKGGIKTMVKQLKSLTKAIPSPAKLGRLLDSAIQMALRHILPLARQIPEKAEKEVKKLLGNGCLKTMLSNIVELPPEPFDIFRKQWNHSNILVQVDNYMPDLCVKMDKLKVDASNLGSFLAKVPKKAMKKLKPLFKQISNSVKNEIIKPIEKIINKVGKALTKGPKKVFEKVKKVIEKLKNFFSGSFLQVAEASVQRGVIAITSGQADKGAGSQALSGEAGKEEQDEEEELDDDDDDELDDALDFGEDEDEAEQEGPEEQAEPGDEKEQELEQEDEEDGEEEQTEAGDEVQFADQYTEGGEKEEASEQQGRPEKAEDEADRDSASSDEQEEEEEDEDDDYPDEVLLQELQQSIAQGRPPIDLKEISFSLQLKIKPSVKLEFGASFSQEGDILGLIAEKLGITDEPWNQKFETRAELIPGALWINVATTMKIAWPYTIAAEARAQALFRYKFTPKLRVGLKNGQFRFDLEDLRGQSDFDASVYGWASVATMAFVRVIITVQICTHGLCFDKTTSVQQSVEAGADVYAQASLARSGFIGDGFKPYAALRSAADFRWQAYPTSTFNKCRDAMPGLCTALWLHVPEPKVDITLGMVLVKKLHRFKKFKNIAGTDSFVDGLFPGTRLLTVGAGLTTLAQNVSNHGEEAAAPNKTLIAVTKVEEFPLPRNVTDAFGMTNATNSTNSTDADAAGSSSTAESTDAAATADSSSAAESAGAP